MLSWDCSDSGGSSGSPYGLLFNALALIPLWHYLLGSLIVAVVFLYTFLEIHFLQDLFSGFNGSPVSLTHHPCSHIYDGVVSKCRVLHGRYLATPWLSSPHIQTVFLNFHGRPPAFSYRRQLFHASDGGTIALDWLMSCDVSGGALHMNSFISKNDTTPIMVVVPGLTSDSASAYIKHLAFSTAKHGWNVVISNHRGLGGVSITSDCFYNAGWTEDIRVVVNYLHREYPMAPLFAVGTSIGANILVKYLGEDGENTPIAGAVALCSPWDLLLGDRFISRRLVQKFYDRALTIVVQGFMQIHQHRYSRLANWEGIKTSRSIRDFDNHATCLVGKFETVDTYYRHCTSTSYVGNVSIPLLCISALDDPVCTKEAIPWDECRANKNVVLATIKHGGHLAFFEGITASGLWWVRAVEEFLDVLHSSPYMHVQKKMQNSGPHFSSDSAIDQGPFVNVADGMVSAMCNEQNGDDVVEELPELQKIHDEKDNKIVSDVKQDGHLTGAKEDDALPDIAETSNSKNAEHHHDGISPIRRCLHLLSRQNRWSMWVLAYIAIMTSWPLVGSALQIFFRKKLRNVLPAAFLRTNSVK
ncbi:LOW QUALITY PROTEIN: embryogenesis-associated protein EMB8 [Corylus avellana]|uniref:LOW QUALITY PROTEIN: embryogenesis-associated protein EMB8 n=1 Tax=Corylus avellana TaxID=13451 RepID=UPI00286A922A|nr:LOW QUALITY PROTEIN: embryogenesis-associated protein EMB8 [Corylus avellana]